MGFNVHVYLFTLLLFLVVVAALAVAVVVVAAVAFHCLTIVCSFFTLERRKKTEAKLSFVYVCDNNK